MRIPKALMPHKVRVRSFDGHGSDGPVLSPQVGKPAPEHRAYVEDKTRLVVDGSGQQVTSTCAVWLDPEVRAAELSQVTVRPGNPRERTSRVVAVTTLDHPRTPSHQIVYLA